MRTGMRRGVRMNTTMMVVGLVLSGMALATIITLSVIFSQHMTRPWDKYRLPDTLKPHTYNVTLWPRLERNEQGLYIFTGNSTVDFECVKETDLILIHSNKLNYTTPGEHHATLTGLDGAAAPAIKTSWLQETTQYLVIQLEGRLKPGKTYQLYTNFVGELADDMEGFYRSEYYEGTQQKVFATTQMQPTDARKVFPCFDEPAMKAVFHMTLIHDRNTVALSNGMETGSIHTTVDGTEVSITKFEPTPRMSTYVLALVVCDYDSIKTPAGAKVMIRVWARREAIAKGQGTYALEKADFILEFFEKYYNVSYPLKKSDQLALEDLSAGAMENWGLIIYKEMLLLHTDDEASRQQVATIIAHEMAHMWFGNLVTIKWWNDIWLNEAFATYASYLAVEIAEPQNKLTNTHIWMDIQDSFSYDASDFSQPIAYPEEQINIRAEIEQVFLPYITYKKGARVLNMLSEFLTEPVFSKGLSNYLKEFAYQNVITTDLWKHLQAEADRSPIPKLPGTIQDLMNPWLYQMGFPLVTIDTKTGSISQKHFLKSPDVVISRPSNYNYEWPIPITWAKNGTKQQRTWLLSKSDVQEPMKTSEWVLANLNVDGFYRVNYDKENWERLIDQLQSDHETIPVLSRAQLMDDALLLAQINKMDTMLALRTTQYLSKETEHLPWESVLGHLNDMRHDTGVYAAIQKYLKKQVLPVYEHYKNATSEWRRIRRDEHSNKFHVGVFSLACEVGVKSCTDLAHDSFKDWMSPWQSLFRRNKIDENLKAAVYCHSVAAGGVKVWESIREKMHRTYDSSELQLLNQALFCTRDPLLLNRHLNTTLRIYEKPIHIIAALAKLERLQPILWNYIRDNSSSIITAHGEDQYLSYIITEVTKSFSTELQLKQLLDFKAAQTVSGFPKAAAALDDAIQRAKVKGKWLSENREKMVQWFTSAAM